MAADNLNHRWAIWVDGRGKAGNAKEYSPPALEVNTVEFQAGDMDAPIPVDDGMAMMEVSFSIAGVDPTMLGLLGFRRGNSLPVTVRSDYTGVSGDAWTLVESLVGMITKVERDALSSGGGQRDKVTKFTMQLSYYKAVGNDGVLVEIDPVNHIRSMDGVDALKDMRARLQV